ncbi:MAG: histidine phosphatase family protein [Chloroflexi bacterium]|nr:histidine phosphatase family protein [Chloroflexota bacterium]
MLKLYLIRHGETDWNADGRIQGHSDIELNARGLEQARRLAARIPEEGAFEALYASPLRRAYRTAELIGQALGLPVHADVRLLERSLGQLEGLTMADIQEKFPEVHHAWHNGGTRPHIPGEESRERFVQRTRDFIRDIRARHSAGRVLAITHGGAITMLLMTGLELDTEHPLPFYIDNASINIVQWGERGARLRVLNDTCHLNTLHVTASGTTKKHAEQKITAAEVQ